MLIVLVRVVGFMYNECHVAYQISEINVVAGVTGVEERGDRSAALTFPVAIEDHV